MDDDVKKELHAIEERLYRYYVGPRAPTLWQRLRHLAHRVITWPSRALRARALTRYARLSDDAKDARSNDYLTRTIAMLRGAPGKSPRHMTGVAVTSEDRQPVLDSSFVKYLQE